ncbi:AT-hook motif nuclear-localized protein 10-like [Hordeum vulgare]|nr:AT-hook motif nuclear-localized protein 10-like [Hordeum vulgare]
MPLGSANVMHGMPLAFNPMASRGSWSSAMKPVDMSLAFNPMASLDASSLTMKPADMPLAMYRPNSATPAGNGAARQQRPGEDGDTRSRTSGLSVSLARSDGRVVGGCVAGMLMAATHVQVVVGSFIAKGNRKPKEEQPKREPTSVPMQTASGFGAVASSDHSDDPGSPIGPNGNAFNNAIFAIVLVNVLTGVFKIKQENPWMSNFIHVYLQPGRHTYAQNIERLVHNVYYPYKSE